MGLGGLFNKHKDSTIHKCVLGVISGNEQRQKKDKKGVARRGQEKYLLFKYEGGSGEEETRSRVGDEKCDLIG